MAPPRLAFLPLALGLAATPAAAIDKGQVQDLMVQCAACHGADGIARASDVPDLAGQHDVYLYNQLRAFKSGVRKHKEMQYLGRHMTDEEMQAIATYYSSLPKQ
ncbi:MAG TPA: cytochrome c [Rhodoblastus sp.]|nr:cytochrome c [Rhodoblastus sp.]